MNQFYRENPSPTAQQLLDQAAEIDAKYGSQFNPPVDSSGNVVGTNGSDPVDSTMPADPLTDSDFGRWADDGGAAANDSTGGNEAGGWPEDSATSATEPPTSGAGSDITEPVGTEASGVSFFDGTFEGGLAGGLGVLGAVGTAYQLYNDINAIAKAPEGQTASVVANKAGSWAGALAGAEVGAEVGAFAGPLGAVLGGAIGGGLGYFGGGQAANAAINLGNQLKNL